MNIILITLKRTEERSRLAIDRLHSYGVSPHILWASDGLDQETASSIPLDPTSDGVNMLPGEVGCLMSWWRACAMIVRNNWPLAIVLEDDAVLMPLKNGRASFQLVFLALRELPQDFDLALLHNHCPLPPELAPDGHTPSFLHVTHPPFTTSAVALSNKGARSLLKHLPPFDRPVDAFFHDNPNQLVAFQPRGKSIDGRYQSNGWFTQEGRFHSTTRPYLPFPTTQTK